MLSPDDTIDYGTRTPGVYIAGSTSGTYALKLSEVSINIGQTWYLRTRGVGDFQSCTYTVFLSNLACILDGDSDQQIWGFLLRSPMFK